MRKYRLYYLIVGTSLGLFLFGLGWATGNYYLVAAGAVMLAAGVATLNIPMPLIMGL